MVDARADALIDAARTAQPSAPDAFTGTFVTAPDGLRLHVRSYGSVIANALTVLCLPGLARTAADFDELARALANDGAEPRRVVALDYRGRGQSDFDRDPRNYSLPVELADVSAVVTALGIAPVVIVGTSRGGILAMLLATHRPTAVAGVVLNDVGPVIEAKGLMRIKSYVGRLPTPRSFEEGADILRRLFGAQFTRFAAEDWLAYARRTWTEKNGGLVPLYDPNLGKALANIDLERPLPTLWNEFDALSRVPVMVIRGANSDILSAATVEAMRLRRMDLDVLEVPDQGHAPVLSTPEVIQRIAGFATFCEIWARR